MPTPDPDKTLSDIINELRQSLDQKGREAINNFLNLEEDIVSRYRDQLGDVLEKQDEVRKEFGRLVAQTIADTSKLHQEYRKSIRDGHDALIDGHLEMVRHMRESLKPRSPGGARTRQRRPSAAEKS
jgi:hypothetical protein